METDDTMNSWSNYSRWKNGPRFQSHGRPLVDWSGYRWPDSPVTLQGAQFYNAETGKPAPVQPASVAASLVRYYGPTRAAQHAEAMKGEHPEYSPAACFYDEVGRAIERGLVEAKAVRS